MDKHHRKLELSTERKIFNKYPYHIYLMVMAAAKLLREGKAKIEDGIFKIIKEETDDKNGKRR